MNYFPSSRWRRRRRRKGARMRWKEELNWR